MNGNNRQFTVTASVTYDAGTSHNLRSRRGIARAEQALETALSESPDAADRLYLDLLRRTETDPRQQAKVLTLAYKPRGKAAVDAMLDAALKLARSGAVEPVGVIARAYRVGRPAIAREILTLTAEATDDPLVLHHLSTRLLIHETDDEALVAVLSVINRRSPYRIGTLAYQADFAGRRQSREILRNVPPITRGVLGCLPPGQAIVFLDGGATGSTVAEQFSGWPAERWKVFGFDPHPDADLSIDHSANVQMIRTALGAARGKVRLFHTAAVGGSSGFKPNLDYIRRLKHGSGSPLDSLMSVVSESEVDVVDLDGWRDQVQAPPFDFMKLNVQGAELEILRGATATLDDCLGVQCEVAFAPIYRDAPVFRDIDAFLDSAGFTFFDLRKPNTSGRVTSRATPMVGSRVGLFRWPSRQMTEAHVLYLRDPFRPEEHGAPRWRKPETWLRLAVVAEMNGQIDLAMQVCEALLENFSATLGDRGAALARSLDEAATFYRDFEIRNL